MHEYLKQAAKDNKVRVIIISAEGSTFSSGHDLKELKKAKESVDKGKNFYKKIMRKMFKYDAAIINNPIMLAVGGTLRLQGVN